MVKANEPNPRSGEEKVDANGGKMLHKAREGRNRGEGKMLLRDRWQTGGEERAQRGR